MSMKYILLIDVGEGDNREKTTNTRIGYRNRFLTLTIK